MMACPCLVPGLIPHLGDPLEMVGSKPDAVSQEHALPAEELLIMVEPVQWIFGAIECREVQFVEVQDAQAILEDVALRGRWLEATPCGGAKASKTAHPWCSPPMAMVGPPRC